MKIIYIDTYDLQLTNSVGFGYKLLPRLFWAQEHPHSLHWLLLFLEVLDGRRLLDLPAVVASLPLPQTWAGPVAKPPKALGWANVLIYVIFVGHLACN